MVTHGLGNPCYGSGELESPAEFLPGGIHPEDELPVAQPGECGIPPDVLDGAVQVLFVPDDPIEAFLLPEGSAAAYESIDLAGGVALPALEDLFQGMFLWFQRAHHCVGVIRHDGVAAEFTPLTFEVVHCANEMRRTFLVLQQAGAVTGIKPFLGAAHCFS